MILEGKTLAAALRTPLAERSKAVQQKLGRPITLFAVGSTEDYGAYVYLKKEVQAAEKLGVRCILREVNSHTAPQDFIQDIARASANPEIDAILIARPLPPALAESGFTRFISPEKDIDGMSNISMGNLFLCKTWADVQALPSFVPCTAMAVIRLLDFYHIDPQGLQAAVVGRSPTVGKPLAHLLTCRNATVTICHTFTLHLPYVLRTADLICSAVGQPGLIKSEDITPAAAVLDISTNLDSNGHLCGDANTAELDAKGCSVSPVPGGVGPVTLACLLENIILSGERKAKEEA